jgi:hypothetical protein
LPKHEAPEWQAAMQALLLVAEHDGPTMFATIGVMRAPNRNVERVFERKETHWANRKLARDRPTNRSLTPPLGEHRRADERRYTGSHTQRVDLDGMALDTQHAMGQIGDSQCKERSTDKGSTAEGEIFHQLNMPVWNAKTTPVAEERKPTGVTRRATLQSILAV